MSLTNLIKIKTWSDIFHLYNAGAKIKRCEKKALVEVRVSNMLAITVYEKSGFATIDIRKNYYKNNGENAYVMVRDFSNEQF